jgi:hypothetical protein
VKVTSLKSIETISMSLMGLRSGPRVHPETRWSSIALLRLGDTDARALESWNLQKPAVAHPGSDKVSLGLAGRDGVAA